MTRKSGDRTTRGETCRCGRRGRAPAGVDRMNPEGFRSRSSWARRCGVGVQLRRAAVTTRSSTRRTLGSFEAGPIPEEPARTCEPEGGDSAAPSTCGNSTGAPERLLLTMQPARRARSRRSISRPRRVDGRFGFDGEHRSDVLVRHRPVCRRAGRRHRRAHERAAAVGGGLDVERRGATTASTADRRAARRGRRALVRQGLRRSASRATRCRHRHDQEQRRRRTRELHRSSLARAADEPTGASR